VDLCFHNLWASLSTLLAQQTSASDPGADFFNFFRWVLAATVTVTLLWPLNIPLAALAYKARHGPTPVPLETQDFWTRATLTALGLGLASLVLVGLDKLLVAAEVPAGIVHLALFIGYAVFAVWFVFWMFALEDLLQGLGVFALYITLSVLPILLLNWLFDWPLTLVAGWFKTPV
jgi:hypothetical protein